MSGIGALIKERRGPRTQKWLAQRIGVSIATVSRWESGSAPKSVVLPAIAEALGVSLDALVGAVPHVPAPTEDARIRELGEVVEAEFRGIAGRLTPRQWERLKAHFRQQARWIAGGVIPDEEPGALIEAELPPDSPRAGHSRGPRHGARSSPRRAAG